MFRRSVFRLIWTWSVPKRQTVVTISQQTLYVPSSTAMFVRVSNPPFHNISGYRRLKKGVSDTVHSGDGNDVGRR